MRTSVALSVMLMSAQDLKEKQDGSSRTTDGGPKGGHAPEG
jgi:hypothetical protein